MNTEIRDWILTSTCFTGQNQDERGNHTPPLIPSGGCIRSPPCTGGAAGAAVWGNGWDCLILPIMTFLVSDERPRCVPTSQNLSVPGIYAFQIQRGQWTVSRTKPELVSHPHVGLRPRPQHQRRLLGRR